MKTIQITECSLEQLNEQIAVTVQKTLQSFIDDLKPAKPETYLSREDVVKLFNVDPSTVHNWCKKGILKPVGMGRRVYYLQSDIEESLVKLGKDSSSSKY